MCCKVPVDDLQEPAVQNDDTSIITPTKLQQGDEWLEHFDFEGFRVEIQALGKKLEAGQGPADVKHLNKMVAWSNMFAAVGLLTMGFGVNPLTIICISTLRFHAGQW